MSEKQMKAEVARSAKLMRWQIGKPGSRMNEADVKAYEARRYDQIERHFRNNQ
ncbi:hypothetical protein ACWGID_29315 [Kribbella sp. NPDC054772]